MCAFEKMRGQQRLNCVYQGKGWWIRSSVGWSPVISGESYKGIGREGCSPVKWKVCRMPRGLSARRRDEMEDYMASERIPKSTGREWQGAKDKGLYVQSQTHLAKNKRRTIKV